MNWVFPLKINLSVKGVSGMFCSSCFRCDTGGEWMEIYLRSFGLASSCSECAIGVGFSRKYSHNAGQLPLLCPHTASQPPHCRWHFPSGSWGASLAVPRIKWGLWANAHSLSPSRKESWFHLCLKDSLWGFSSSPRRGRGEWLWVIWNYKSPPKLQGLRLLYIIIK